MFRFQKGEKMRLFKWSYLGAFLLFIAVHTSAQFSVKLPYKQVTVEVVNDTAKFSGALVSGGGG